MPSCIAVPVMVLDTYTITDTDPKWPMPIKVSGINASGINASLFLDIE